MPQLTGKIAVSITSAGGGWITFPGGIFSPDPSSRVLIPGFDGGEFGRSFVPALNRWLPVPRAWVSPDGMTYAYIDGCQLRVLSVTGTDKTLSLPSAAGPCSSWWEMVATEETGVLVSPPFWVNPYATGLWLVYFNGSARQVTSEGHWSTADGRYAYGFLTSDSPRGAADTIVRVDLLSGSIEEVFAESGMLAAVVGIDNEGQAVIQTFDDVEHPTLWQIWLAKPGVMTRIYEGPATQPAGAYGYSGVTSVVADRMGTWMTTVSGLYLFSRSGGLELASPVTGQLGSILVH